MRLCLSHFFWSIEVVKQTATCCPVGRSVQTDTAAGKGGKLPTAASLASPEVSVPGGTDGRTDGREEGFPAPARLARSLPRLFPSTCFVSGPKI